MIRVVRPVLRSAGIGSPRVRAKTSRYCPALRSACSSDGIGAKSHKGAHDGAAGAFHVVTGSLVRQVKFVARKWGHTKQCFEAFGLSRVLQHAEYVDDFAVQVVVDFAVASRFLQEHACSAAKGFRVNVMRRKQTDQPRREPPFAAEITQRRTRNRVHREPPSAGACWRLDGNDIAKYPRPASGSVIAKQALELPAAPRLKPLFELLGFVFRQRRGEASHKTARGHDGAEVRPRSAKKRFHIERGLDPSLAEREGDAGNLDCRGLAQASMNGQRTAVTGVPVAGFHFLEAAGDESRPRLMQRERFHLRPSSAGHSRTRKSSGQIAKGILIPSAVSCFTKNATPAALQLSRIRRIQSQSVGRAPEPLSVPAITQ